MVRAADGGGGGSSNYSSIQFDGMRSLIATVRSAGSTLQETTHGLQSRASGCGVSSPAFSQIIEIGSWAEEQVPGLERRLSLARGAAASIGTTLSGWTITEPVQMTEAEATAKGEALAQRILDHNRTDQDFVSLTGDTLDELQRLYGQDPDVLSAFYATLGPELQFMPSLLEASGAQDTTELEKISRTFALAMNDEHPPQAFTDLLESLKTPTGREPDPTNWDRLALLQWGDFPPDFVADVVRANGLEKLDEEDDPIDWRASMTYPLGMDGDLRTLIFGALRNNPEATRTAFEGLDMDDITAKIYDEGGFDFELQENFIQAMRAGTGADDESMGAHSADASRFALAFIHASAQVEDVPDLWVTKEGLAAIAASYAPEFVAGSNSMDAQDRRSGLGRPDNFDVPVGLDPAFFLSQQDVYRFLHGFGEQDERFDPPHDYSAPFDDAVGELYQSSLRDAAAELKRHPNSDVWDDTLGIYGNLAGLHLQAQLDVRGDQDSIDQHNKDLMAMLMLKGVGFIPTPQGLVLKGGLMAGKFIASKAIKSWRDTDPETTRKALLEDADVQASFLTDYELMNALQQADYPGTEDIPPALLDGGHLVAPDRIAKDPDLIKAYQHWVDSTDGPTDTDLDSMTEGGKNIFQGGLRNGQNYGSGFGWDE